MRECCQTSDEGGQKSWMHKCRAWCDWLYRLAVVLGVGALVAAWVTERTGGLFLGFGSEHLFHDAIVLLVLALICRKEGEGSCS